MQKLSVIIPTFNEEHNIRAVLESVSWADELIVVDSFSTDQTMEIAGEFTDRLLQREYAGPADQKNWAIPQARHEWILLLDADERPTPGLIAEIQEWLKQEEVPFDAFWIGRQNYFMGKKIRFSGWQGDAVVRFFRRDVCRYNQKQVHEEIITEGIRVSHLKHKIEHYTFKDSTHFLNKIQRYGKWSAEDHFSKTSEVTFFHLFLKPLFRFCKHFLIQRGFLDGKTGFIISVMMAWSVFLRYVYLLESNRVKKNEFRRPARSALRKNQNQEGK